MKKIIFYILTLVILSKSCLVFGYDDEKTHPALTEKAINISLLKTSKFLSNNFGDIFPKDLDSNIINKSVVEYLMEGSQREDSPNCRAASHFLNPLKLWADAGVSDSNKSLLGIGTDAWCFVTS